MAAEQNTNSPLKIVNLKNGGEVPLIIVTTTLISLESVYTDGIDGYLASYDLKSSCADPKYQITYSSSLKILNGLGLLEKNKCSHHIKDIVLSSFEGDALNLRLVSPLNPEQIALQPIADPNLENSNPNSDQFYGDIKVEAHLDL